MTCTSLLLTRIDLSLPMYKTEDVDAIATVTELRSDTSTLVDRVRGEEDHVLIQKNNEPHAVLIGAATYSKIKEQLGVSELSELTDHS